MRQNEKLEWMRRLQMSKSKKYFYIILTVILLAIISFIPIPYVIESPGTAEDVSQFLTVNGTKDEEEGTLRVLTVYVEQATVLTSLKQFFKHHEILPEEKVFGNYTPEEYNQLQEFSMRNARSKAVRVAFEAAGKSVESKVNGIFVTRVDQNSNFRDKLKVGDTIETIDGKRLENTDESLEKLQDYLSSLKPGHYLSLMVKRDGKPQLIREQLKMNSRTGRIRLGFDGEIDEDVTSDPSIEFDPHGVSGPSGGLMFTLEIYNQITNSHLKKGHNIAGTGTIELDGRVGRIGGIDKKLVAAIEAGATVFLAPDDEITDEMRERYPDIKTNYEEVKEAAEKLGTDIKIYPVKTLQEAIEILKNL